MAKYELVEKTEINGEVWYLIKKDGYYVSDSVTQKLEKAETMFSELEQGKPSEPIFKTLKIIEVDEDETN
jgi:hypothetical protein